MLKRIKLGMVLLLIVAIVAPHFTYADQDLQQIGNVNVEVYDRSRAKYETKEVPVVNLMFGKEDILTTDVPAFIMDGRTLVPIYFIAETLGAKVEWKQETMQAIINKDGKEIVLTIDSKDALVNGKKVALPNGVPAKLVTYEGSARTVVPFRFVSEQLGMDIKWFEGTYTAVIDYPLATVESVKYTTYNGIPAIAIKANAKVNYSSMYLPAVKLGTLDTVIIDVPNANIGKNNFFRETVEKNGIIGYRASVINADTRDTTRVTVELEVGGSYKTYYDGATNTIYVTFVNEIAEIEFQESSQAVVIKTDKNPAYNVTDLGDRVAIDILDAKIDTLEGSINIGNNVVNQVRYSQYDQGYNEYSKVVRVVFDLKKGTSLEDNMYIDALNKDIIVYMTTDPLNQFKYEYITAMVESQVVLDLNGVSNYMVTHDATNKVANVRVKKSDISLINEMRLDLYDGIINYIEIDGEKENLYYNIQVKYNSETTAKIATGSLRASSIILGFTNMKSKPQETSPYRDILVVLDPGHGGKDPGASAGGVQEKFLNLDTALKLRELLEEAGFKVKMTREKDVYIGLYERADYANALNADLFLSIHHNAASPSANGVLTVYDGSVMPSKTAFAKTIQNAAYQGLGAKNMGLQNRPTIVVTRETKMPSALPEMGFMTNANELELLKQNSYRQKSAQALFNGIKTYVDTQM